MFQKILFFSFFLIVVLQNVKMIEKFNAYNPIYILEKSEKQVEKHNRLFKAPLLKLFFVDSVFKNFDWKKFFISFDFMKRMLVKQYFPHLKFSFEAITAKCSPKELAATFSTILTRMQLENKNHSYAVILHNCDMSCQIIDQLNRIIIGVDLYISMCTTVGVEITDSGTTPVFRYDPIYMVQVPYIIETLFFLNITCVNFITEPKIIVGQEILNTMDYMKRHLNGCVTHEIFDANEKHSKTDKFGYNPTVYMFLMPICSVSRYLELRANTYFHNKKIILVFVGHESYYAPHLITKFNNLLMKQKRSILLKIVNTNAFKHSSVKGELNIDPLLQTMHEYFQTTSVLYENAKDRGAIHRDWTIKKKRIHPLQHYSVQIILSFLRPFSSKRRTFTLFQYYFWNTSRLDWKGEFMKTYLQEWTAYPTYKTDICGLDGSDCKLIPYKFNEVFFQFVLIVTSIYVLVLYSVARVFFNYFHLKTEVQEFFIPVDIYQSSSTKKSTQTTMLERLKTMFVSTTSQLTSTRVSTESEKTSEETIMTSTNINNSEKFSKKTNSSSGVESSKKSLNSDQFKAHKHKKRSPEVPVAKDSPHNQKHITYEEDEIYLFEMAPKKIRDNAFSTKLVEELVDIKRINHENLLPLVGISISPPQIYMLAAKHGSLRDIIDDNCLSKVFNLNLMVSLLTDIAKGMDYLHNSRIGSHGHLRSSQCVIDDRWHCKISGYGLSELRKQKVEKPESYHKFLYTSPELLRKPIAMRNYYGSRTGDVYAFAIILQEVILMNRPYAKELQEGLKVEQILAKVRSKKVRPPFRPRIGEHYPLEWRLLAEVCWNEDPEKRFTFKEIIVVLRKLAGNDQITFAEALSDRLEQNAKNLGFTVMELTAGLQEASEKAYNLLSHLLPTNVADDYILGKSYKTEMFESVSIMCTDMKGFTKISSACTPRETIEYLNKIYSIYDNIIESKDAYKLETIGDAYIVISGCPIRNGYAHASQIASVALNLLKEATGDDVPLLAGNKIGTRVGIHSGPVFAGVVGLKVPKFCVFGTTYSTAEKMESSSEVDRILISEDTYAILDRKQFLCEKSGPVETDEKTIQTWFLVLQRYE